MIPEPVAEHRREVMLWLFPLFLVSGATGLVYQTLWARSLELVFGTSTFAISTVLASFMGGLALGGWVMARRADRLANPLRAYGLLEVGIGAYALVFPAVVSFIEPFYLEAWRTWQPSPVAFGMLQFVLVGIALVLPTALMGATLPLLARYATDRLEAAGGRVGALYAVNTAGAVVGTLICGFLLLPWLGHATTNALAAMGNFVLGGLALWLARVAGPLPTRPVVAARPATARRWALLAASAAAGFASMVDEVAWTRVLVLNLGASVYAFSVMLVALLSGIAIGGWVGGRLADRLLARWGPGRVLVGFSLVEIGVALASWAAMHGFVVLPYVFVRLFDALGAAESPLAAIVVSGVLAALVMFIPAVFMGMAFPLAVRAVVGPDGALGEPVGSVYGANTAGAVLGAFVAGFIWLPHIGVQRTLFIGIAVNVAAAAVLLSMREIGRRDRWMVGLAFVMLAPLLFGVVVRPPWNPLWMTAGMYKYVTDLPDDDRSWNALWDYAVNRYQLRFYAEGLSSVVTVAQNPETGNLWLANNGKVDASTSVDMPTQLLVGLLPFPFVERAEDVLVIGLASGITAGAVTVVPGVRRLDVVELEPATIAAAQLFSAFNHNVLNDPRTRIIRNDGRNHILLTPPQTYDVIVSEPSNPWLSGVANLFTREFLAEGRQRLKPGGVWAQWVQIYGMGKEDLRSLLATFAAVYPHVELFSTIEDADLVILGSDQPIPVHHATLQKFLDRAPVAAGELTAVGLGSADDLLSTWIHGRHGVATLTAGAELNTDDNLRIEYSAPLHLYQETASENLEWLVSTAGSPELGDDPVRLARLARAYLRRDDYTRAYGAMAHAIHALLPRFSAHPGAAPDVAARAMRDAGALAAVQSPVFEAEWQLWSEDLSRWLASD